MFSQTRVPRLSSGSATSNAGAASASVVAHDGASIGMPETFVGAPAVIACTTSCCVVALPVEEPGVPAEPQDRDAVGDREDVVKVVRDQDDREPLLAEPLDEREHLLGLRDAERSRRLVEDDELRVPHHGSRDRDRLALAS